VTAAPLPLLAGGLWSRLARLDSREVDPARLDLLAGLPIFAPLSTYALERLAAQLAEHAVAAREAVYSQGDGGDAFYVIESGDVDVVKDGATVSTLGPSDFFGEIALLRDVPRTATIRATSDVRLLCLDRDSFLATVTGNQASASAA